ncbi:aldo/keto reductase family protein [Aspergillus homomorphus CBS 101889]|uniref:D-xylose reductase [NAD(P)H] n=1 Tax=Aspergillus homomorphus (strain CBS 101889) TaxID=1450537 RepID=A0A395HWE7_ASPHC|nr:Aldo/keto reductase [Aspergillus homomorphus CBS 101889]RAL10544.1 Aldo/keto reductase [Aspergillus homomorphus CBS 101889]
MRPPGETPLPESFNVKGYTLPAVGLGTFQAEAGNYKVKDAVIKALISGYRHIDTATAYGNEQQVGEAIRECGVPRDQLFITTKLPQTCHAPADVEKALDRSLRLLQMDYGDHSITDHCCCDIQWTFPYAYRAGPENTIMRYSDGKPVIDHELSRQYPATWAAMERLVDKGKVRLIGVSNFNTLKINRLLQTARIPPAVNQIEIHPYLQQTELVAFCKERGIHVMAHQPLGGKPDDDDDDEARRPRPLYEPVIALLSIKNYRSPAQIMLAWHLQRGISVIPRTVRMTHIMDNINLKSLTSEGMESIAEIETQRAPIRYLNPQDQVGFDIFDETWDEPVERPGRRRWLE